MMIPHLTAKSVATAGLIAHSLGILSAQYKSPECRYRTEAGYPCVIGVCLDDKTAKKFDSLDASTIEDLIEGELVAADDLDELVEIQLAHDNWAQAVAGTNTRNPAEAEAAFLTLCQELAR